MQTQLTNLNDTKIKLSIKAARTDLSPIKEKVLARLGKDVKLPGFRAGKAPKELLEKNIDQNLLQSEFLDEAMTALYTQAAISEKVRPVAKPEVSVKKFVPFSTLEFEITTDIVGKIKLANYKLMKQAKSKPEVLAKDIDNVLDSLSQRLSEKTEVKRPAKAGDEALIDFKGVDEKGEPINGAEGKDYPLVLGSNQFIPGFEDNLLGQKASDEKTFELTFPKDYGVKALADKKVKFTVTVQKVQEMTKPKLDDAFAAKVGPFKTLKELKDDIKKQLTVEKENEINRNFANELIEKIVDKSTLALPDSMVEHQIEHSLEELKRNLVYRGQTFQEFLKAENMSEEKYRKEVLTPQAEKQVKGSLILSEIAEAEGLSVTPEELEIHIQILKGQYQDSQMQAELDKPQNRQDIATRLLTEKVLGKLEGYATKDS